MLKNWFIPLIYALATLSPALRLYFSPTYIEPYEKMNWIAENGLIKPLLALKFLSINAF